MKRIDGGGIALLLDLDDCIGCYGCEAACRETYRYPYHEDWLKVIRREPFLVDGKLRQYHLIAPVLDKCKLCYDADPNPLCVTGCAAQCLKIGPFATAPSTPPKPHSLTEGSLRGRPGRPHHHPL